MNKREAAIKYVEECQYLPADEGYSCREIKQECIEAFEAGATWAEEHLKIK